MAGSAVSGAGRELEQASDIVAATTERQDNLVAQDASNALQNAATKQQFDPQVGWANAKEGQAVGQQFIVDNTQKFVDAQQALRGNLQTENQRKIFDQHSEIQGLRFQSALLAHQAQQTDAFNTSTENATIDNSLAAMARDPSNELNFQTGLTQINGTIDQSVQRRGLPAATATDLKTKYLDAAYTTRILSIKDGIPGVVQANPYLAEKMFKQVQDQLQPTSQVHLAFEVQKAVQSVQARDTAQAMIFGQPPTNPQTLHPVVTGQPLQAVVESMESGGRDTNSDGSTLTSPAGAQGRMQVMPGTATNPGYGVMPARDNSTDELARVGRDYLGAMTARYNDPALVMAAYNAGPGQVDKWIQQFGDPRSGQISSTDWASKIPFAETQKYVTEGLHRLNAQAGQPNAPIAAPTANNLKTDLYQRVLAARAIAEQQYPGDTAYADSVASRVENYGRTVISNQQGVQLAAHDQLMAGMIGTKPDGSDSPLNIDQLLSDPQQQANWDKATPEVKQAIQDRFARGNRFQPSDPKVVNDLTQRIYLPDGDPRKISEPGDLYQYIGAGGPGKINFTDMEHLRKQMTEANTPEGSPFLKQSALVKDTGRKMLVGSLAAMNPVAMAHPDIADEAAYRFGIDVDNKVKDYRTKGKDPHSLFDPNAPDYVLAPSRVAAFMPTEAQITAQAARAPGSLAAPIPKITNDADFNALPPGTRFIAPDGSRRVKPS